MFARQYRVGSVFCALLMTGCTPLLVGGNRPESTTQPVAAVCHSGGSSDITKVAVPGHPFDAIASRDGCWIFASLVSLNPNPVIGTTGGGIGVFRWTGTRPELQRVVQLSPPRPAGIALSHDGRLLVAADGRFVHFLDVGRLMSGAGDPLLGSIRDAQAPGSVYVAISADDRTAFVSDEQVSAVTVIDLQRARRTGYHQNAIVGNISTGRAPVGLAFSHDGRYLFITSEVWPGRPGWPIDCHPGPGPRPVGAGAVEVVDVARARIHPIEAVIGRTPASCSPVRAVLSPDGARLYVSARGSNALLVFDASKLINDSAQALLTSVRVGSAPVGVEVVDAGQRVVIADSNRFRESTGEDLTVIDTSRIDQGAATVTGTFAVGAFPRELHATADGGALILTDYNSDQIELIPVARLAGPLPLVP